MGTTRILAAVTLVAIVTAIIVVIVDPAFAEIRPNLRGAPGPIAGAGLITVVIGACAYWLLRRTVREHNSPSALRGGRLFSAAFAE